MNNGEVNDTVSSLVTELRAGNRRALAHVLSTLESTADDHTLVRKELSRQLLESPHQSRRIGLTGPPGVGKSTLIEELGLRLIERGEKVAVLAVDPSSARTGGSILGDQVRMQKLAQHNDAFVRPSPSRTSLGGTARSTRESILACELAGFTTVIVETVGVGQSEIDVAGMVDLFVLLLLPASGDDIQGIKRGIMEVADVVVVTKADIDPVESHRSVALLESAVKFMQPNKHHWSSVVHQLSALSGEGIQELIDITDRFFDSNRSSAVNAERSRQQAEWFNRLVADRCYDFVVRHPEVANALSVAKEQVQSHLISAPEAVDSVFGQFEVTKKSTP